MSRVTGGERSLNDGLLRSEIAGANLFLLNPSGVLFGPDATLDVSGSFHVGTADFLRMADGTQFFADLSRQSTLTVAPPTAFGFLGPAPTPITTQESVLKVPERKTLSVVSGDIDIAGGSLGQLVAPGGGIHLASVASAGEVPLSLSEFPPRHLSAPGRGQTLPPCI